MKNNAEYAISPSMTTSKLSLIKELYNLYLVAAIAGVNPSSIRHWEKERLIRSERNPENGYRVFTQRELKKLLLSAV
jgi:hypothetical protein